MSPSVTWLVKRLEVYFVYWESHMSTIEISPYLDVESKLTLTGELRLVVYDADNQVSTYLTKEQGNELMLHLHKLIKEGKDDWVHTN